MQGHKPGSECIIIKVGPKCAPDIGVGDTVTVGEVWCLPGEVIYTPDDVPMKATHTFQRITSMKADEGYLYAHPVAWMIPVPDEDQFMLEELKELQVMIGKTLEAL